MAIQKRSNTTKTQFLIRRATLNDAPAIGKVHTQSWKTTYQGIVHQSFLDSIDLNTRISWAEKKVNNPKIDAFVLIDSEKDQIVGFADIGPCREKNIDADGELYAIYLFQEHQGQGGGKLLFQECLSVAKTKGYSKLMVSVLENNLPSRKFYKKLGGQYSGADHVDIDGHRYPTATYLWKIA